MCLLYYGFQWFPIACTHPLSSVKYQPCSPLRRTSNFFGRHIVAVKHFHNAHPLSLNRRMHRLGQTKDRSNLVTCLKADGQGKATTAQSLMLSPNSPSAVNHPQHRDCWSHVRFSLLLVTSTGHHLP